MSEMQLKFSKIVDSEKRKAEMFCYGIMGDNWQAGEFNGHYFARELNYMGKNYDEITVRVNSDGGTVSHGLSIVSEMLQSSAVIITKNDGIAASMGAVVLACGDRVLANDYSKTMVHSPYYVDENGEELKKLSEKDKKALAMVKDTLMRLLQKRGIDAAKVEEMMKTDTWFTADEALAAGLVDEVITTGKKKERALLEPKRLVALIMNENEHNSKINMKKVIAKLNLLGAKLTDEATDEQIVAAIGEVVKPAAPEVAALSKTVVDKLLAVGRKSGAVTDQNEAAMRELAAEKPDLFAGLIDTEKLNATPAKPEGDNLRISELVKELRNQAPVTSKKWADLTDAERDALEEKNPTAYAALYKAHFGVELSKMK